MTLETEIGGDDSQLVAGVLAGDPACFAALHRRYRDRIYRYALKRLGDPLEAEDVTQEVFLNVFRCLPSFRGESRLLTWMFGIAHHQVGRRLRRRMPSTVSLEHPDASGTAAREPATERRIEAARLLERCQRVLDREVSPSSRRAFHLRYASGRSQRDIASELGTSTNAVKLSLLRTRRTLASRVSGVRTLFDDATASGSSAGASGPPANRASRCAPQPSDPPPPRRR